MTVNKVLFCATVDIHFRRFHLPYLQWFKEQGWEVHVAAAGDLELPYVDRKLPWSVQRSPVRRQNIKAYRELKSWIEEHRYALIHCHTPMGGALARLAAQKARKSGTKVLYTAHGFHFYRGASPLNWLLYYPVEKWLSSSTDCLITINEEDYELAVRRRFKAGNIVHIHGVGVDSDLFRPLQRTEREALREARGYTKNDFLLFYAAEFNANKNQQLLIRALAAIRNEAPRIRLLLAGDGPLLEACKNLAASLGVGSQIDFLGYRNDVDKWLPMCDAAVSSSRREGLPVHIMEAMSCGLPIAATNIRGHRELVRHESNGLLVNRTDVREMAEAIQTLATRPLLCRRFGSRGRRMIEEKYGLHHVLGQKVRLYQSLLADGSAKEAEEWQSATP